ncbi:MAG: TonB family protein [Bacteroidales bacterium]|nr:TonB family protein [Bacteroidales bacterium]
MAKYGFILSMIFFSFHLSGQNNKIYYDSLWNETDSANHQYYRMVTGYSKIMEAYLVNDHYKGGKIQMEGWYSDQFFTKKTGKFKYYYENGNLAHIENYVNDSIAGEYKTWYENGDKEFECVFLKREATFDPDGSGIIINYWDENAEQLVIKGHGRMVFHRENGSFFQGNIRKGVKDSIWTGYYQPFNLTYTEFYKDGMLIDGESTDSLGVKHKYNKIKVSPEPVDGFNGLKKYISKNVVYPAIARQSNIQGLVIVEFNVNQEGKITDVDVPGKADKYLKQEALSVIKSYKKRFTIPYYRGFPCIMSMKQPVSFKLN